MNVLKQAWRSYQSVLKRHPYKMQSLQTAILMGTGDVIAQTYVEKTAVRDVDTWRFTRFTAIGTCVGPALHLWYSWLDRVAGGARGWAVTRKLLMDQMLAAPVMLCAILSAVTLLGRPDLTVLRAKLRQDYLPVLFANYKVWPLVQLCNFALVPLQYRVLVVQMVAVLWNTYLSRRANYPVVT